MISSASSGKGSKKDSIQQKLIDDAQYEWGKGSVQKRELEERQQEFQEIVDEPFARLSSDPKLEEHRKSVIREGDPMAKFLLEKKGDSSKKRKAGTAEVSRSNKPKYSGPLPPPNRFGIIPGYRWDAVDRGNGFEHKLLIKMNERRERSEFD